jgi:hypothetical protein
VIASIPPLRPCLVCGTKWRFGISESRYKLMFNWLLKRCFICGSQKLLERHHLGGKNHFPYFTITLCRSHHRELTHYITWAKIEMRHTRNKEERQRRALQAYSVFHWYMTKQQLEAYPQRSKLLGSVGAAFHHYVVHQSSSRKGDLIKRRND